MCLYHEYWKDFAGKLRKEFKSNVNKIIENTTKIKNMQGLILKDIKAIVFKACNNYKDEGEPERLGKFEEDVDIKLKCSKIILSSHVDAYQRRFKDKYLHYMLTKEFKPEE